MGGENKLFNPYLSPFGRSGRLSGIFPRLPVSTSGTRVRILLGTLHVCELTDQPLPDCVGFPGIILWGFPSHLKPKFPSLSSLVGGSWQV